MAVDGAASQVSLGVPLCKMAFSLVEEFTDILSWASCSQCVSCGHRDWLNGIMKLVAMHCISAVIPVCRDGPVEAPELCHCRRQGSKRLKAPA